jgi:hypothetical protein
MASKAIPLVAGNMTPDSDLPSELSGLTQGSTGTIVVHDSTDATGPIVLASAAVGTVSLQTPVRITTGIFVVITGAATGSLLV